jgi:hypothetical protein
MFKVQAHEKRTVSWWYSKRDKIDVDPPYQRKGDIWGDKDKAYLIDSILNEYDIPKMYFADFNILDTPLNTKNLPYAVVDGRQRLEAIFGFINDEVALNDDFILFSKPSWPLAGLRYSALKENFPSVADTLDQFNLDVMSVITDDEGKIRDLFLRLNRSKNLTGAELRNAMSGVVPDFIRKLTDRRFFHECVRFNTGRRQDSNVAAKLLLIELHGDFVDTKKKQLDRMVKEGQAPENFDAFLEVAHRVEKNLEIMEGIFFDKDPLLASNGLVPLIYEMVKRNPSKREKIRPFLLEFFKERRAAKMLRSDTSKISPDILAFEAAARSINDESGLTAAYKILEYRFNNF